MSESAKSGEWYDVPYDVPYDGSQDDQESADVRSAAVPLPPTLLLALWLVGATALLLPLAAGWLGVRRLERRSTSFGTPRVRHLATRLALRLGLKREFRLVAGPERAMPMTWGIVRPVILLPADAEGWPEARLEAVLLHELAHVKRRDCLTQLLAELTRAAHWFNPLVWVAARRLRVERERACDDAALAAGARASGYATELLDLARQYRASRATTLAAVAMARPSQLSDRLLAVLDEGRRRGEVGPGTLLRAAAVAVAILIPLAGLAPAVAAAPSLPMITPSSTHATTGEHVPSGRSLPDDEAAVEGVSDDVVRGDRVPEAPHPEAPRPGEAHPEDAHPEAPAPPQAAGVASVVAGSALRAQEPTCAAQSGEWHQVQQQSNNDRITIRMSRPGCDLDVRLEGDVELDAAAATVARMGRDARIRIEEDDGRLERYLELRPGAGGAPSYDYRENGREAEFGGGPQAWYRAVLLHLFRSAGFASEERVAALLARGGVEAVLAELGQIQSSFVFARYTRELLERARLEEAELRALVRSSGRRVESDHYMAEILEAVARHQPLRGGMLDDYIVAAMTLESDHYRSETLRTVVRAGGLTNEQVAGVLEAAGAMDSDHYKAELLTDVADRYALEPEFRHAYLTATAEMDSDHYRSEVLERLLARTDLSSREMADVIGAASMLDSDHYRSEILKEVAQRGLGDPALHRAFFDAAAALDSDHAYGETMKMLVDQDGLTPALLVNVLDHAGVELDSDHALSELLLRVLARHRIEDGPVRAAFLRAMDSIGSDHSRGRVADALLRADRGGA